MSKNKIALLASALLFSVVTHAETPRAPEPISGNPILNKDGSRTYLPGAYPSEASAPDRYMESAEFRKKLCAAQGARDVTNESTMTLSEHASGGMICERELTEEEANDLMEAARLQKKSMPSVRAKTSPQQTDRPGISPYAMEGIAALLNAIPTAPVRELLTISGKVIFQGHRMKMGLSWIGSEEMRCQNADSTIIKTQYVERNMFVSCTPWEPVPYSYEIYGCVNAAGYIKELCDYQQTIVIVHE